MCSVPCDLPVESCRMVELCFLQSLDPTVATLRSLALLVSESPPCQDRKEKVWRLSLWQTQKWSMVSFWMDSNALNVSHSAFSPSVQQLFGKQYICKCATDSIHKHNLKIPLEHPQKSPISGQDLFNSSTDQFKTSERQAGSFWLWLRRSSTRKIGRFISSGWIGSTVSLQTSRSASVLKPFD